MKLSDKKRRESLIIWILFCFSLWSSYKFARTRKEASVAQRNYHNYKNGKRKYTEEEYKTNMNVL